MSGQVNKDPCFGPALTKPFLQIPFVPYIFSMALYSRLFKNICGYSYSILGTLYEISMLQFCVNLSGMYTTDFNNVE